MKVHQDQKGLPVIQVPLEYKAILDLSVTLERGVPQDELVSPEPMDCPDRLVALSCFRSDLETAVVIKVQSCPLKKLRQRLYYNRPDLLYVGPQGQWDILEDLELWVHQEVLD